MKINRVGSDSAADSEIMTQRCAEWGTGVLNPLQWHGKHITHTHTHTSDASKRNLSSDLQQSDSILLRHVHQRRGAEKPARPGSLN